MGIQYLDLKIISELQLLLAYLPWQEDRQTGDFSITFVNRAHELLADFRPMPARATAVGAIAGGDVSASISASASTSCSASVAQGAELCVEELWRAGRELRPVTEAVGIPSDAMFTSKEVREIDMHTLTHNPLLANWPVNGYIC